MLDCYRLEGDPVEVPGVRGSSDARPHPRPPETSDDSAPSLSLLGITRSFLLETPDQGSLGPLAGGQARGSRVRGSRRPPVHRPFSGPRTTVKCPSTGTPAVDPPAGGVAPETLPRRGPDGLRPGYSSLGYRGDGVEGHYGHDPFVGTFVANRPSWTDPTV